MLRIPNPGRGLVRCLGLAAAAILLLSAATGERAEALSLANPGAVPAAKYVSDGWTTEVRGGHGGGGHGGGFHGGGGGGGFRGGGAAFHASGIRSGGAVFHGGGYRSGAAVFRGGGYRSGHVFRGGGYRYSGIRYGGYRYGGHRFAHRHHHFHRRFFYGPSYYDDYPYYSHYRRCRVIWTYYGPRRVCHFRHWRHHRYW